MSAFDAYCELDGALDGTVACDERMSRHVTYRIGGTADLFVECASIADIKKTIDVLQAWDIPWAVIGKGSNLLVADAGCRCAIITLGAEFKKTSLQEGLLIAGAGVPLSKLVQDAFKQGSTGFEFAVGIPGTLGGALFMNAGSRDHWIGSIVDSLTVFDPQQGLMRLAGNEVSWGYRQSGISRDFIILEAALHVTSGDVSTIREDMEESLSRRKKTQPLSLPSAGSVFKNPDGFSAGQLIESVGLKGAICGGAQISELHANFIVNKDNATAQDVIELITLARSRVKEVHGIELQPEVQFLGF